MKKIKYILFVLIAILIPTFVNAKEPVNVYVFYGDGCPHCEDLFTFLDELKENKDYKDKFKIVKYETWYDEENAELGSKVASYLNTNFSGVPFYIIGDYSNSGFPSLSSTDSSVKEAVKSVESEIKKQINEKYKEETEDIVSKIKSGKIKVTTTTTESTTTETTTTKSAEEKLESKLETDSSFSSEVKWLLVALVTFVCLVISYFVIKWVVKD